MYNRCEVHMIDKELIAKRLKNLRESAKLSQAKLAKEINVKQPLIARYETAINTPAYGVLVTYADYFNVSCDYLLGRTDNPQGKLYECVPQSLTGDPQMKEFVDMCFDPSSPASARMKDTLLKLLEEQNNG